MDGLGRNDVVRIGPVRLDGAISLGLLRRVERKRHNALYQSISQFQALGVGKTQRFLLQLHPGHGTLTLRKQSTIVKRL